MLATCVPAKAKKLQSEATRSASVDEVALGLTYRNRKVPTNSPDMAMKWLRGPLGIFLKKAAGLMGGIFSGSPLSASVTPLLFVLFLRLCPKIPGRKPCWALILSMMGEGK